jgi:hypothetical protein
MPARTAPPSRRRSDNAPTGSGRSRAVATAAAALLTVMTAYHVLVRPRLLRWGATKAEIDRALPGDDRVRDPFVVSTRAVSIAAAPRDVWPWLAQMGNGRGGLYSYDRLDMLFGYLVAPSSDVILQEFQQLAAGDVIPLGRGPDWPVYLADPEHALVVEPTAGNVTWCWALDTADDSCTRLVSRVRSRVGSRSLVMLLGPLVDLPWFLMERKMLLGIARRAEARCASHSSTAAESSATAG